ncbi:MAG: hypothetical protein IJF73_03485 [Clostridia bacterium]|nr:hypothetical protein [Clostridia bacterium]
MKKHVLILLLAACLLLSATALVASAVPMDGNVGDSSGVVTSGADTGLLTSMTPTTTVAPVTTPAPATTTAAPATTRPVTTAPVTTGAPMDEEGTSVLGIVLAVLAAAAAVVLALVFIPKMKKR